MSIRARLFITYIVAIIFAVSSVAVLVVWQINRYAETNFAENAGGQLERIDNVLTLFVENGKSSAAYLAAIPAVLIYNMLGSSLAKYAARLEAFSAEFGAILARQTEAAAAPRQAAE